MKRLRHFVLFVTLALAAIPARASRPFLCCDYPGGKVCLVAADGTIEWEYRCKGPQDCWLLPNGNILFCFLAGAREVTRDQRIVWEYKAPTDVPVEVHSCQPLPDGSVLLVECGPSRIIEVDRAGKIAKEIKLVTLPSIKLHMQFRGTRKLANGHYVVCFTREGKIVELDDTGRVVRTIPVPGDPHEVVPLPNGNLLIACGDGHKVIEIDAQDKVVWELNETDLPGHPLRLMAGCQRLPNGNTVFCNYLGHGHIGRQPQVFEITRDKRVVWSFADHARFKSINQIQVLDSSADPARGPVLR